MKAYYNEFDKYPAQWLRNLIDAGLIAPGDVDERSIEDVTPTDLAGYDRCHFFAGIAGWERALQLAGWPESWPVWTGSCPCQPFSSAGKGGRGADERHLWPAWFHLIRVCRPPVIFGEQVASKDGLKWLDLVCSDLEAEGYAVGAADLCAAGVGAPHIRQRVWFIALGENASCLRRRGRGDGDKAGEQGALQVERLSPARLLGHAEEQRGGAGLCDSGQAGVRRDEFADSSPTISLGQSENGGCEGNLLHQIPGRRDRKRPVTDASRPSPTGELANAFSAGVGGGNQRGLGEGGREMGEQENGKGFADQPGDRCKDVGILAIPEIDRPLSQETSSREIGWRATEPCMGSEAPFWHDCQWLPCRDGKWRPTKPGLSPLAHGVRNRVGKLRAIGNSIVPQVAAEFIKAVMEAMNCNQ